MESGSQEQVSRVLCGRTAVAAPALPAQRSPSRFAPALRGSSAPPPWGSGFFKDKTPCALEVSAASAAGLGASLALPFS